MLRLQFLCQAIFIASICHGQVVADDSRHHFDSDGVKIHFVDKGTGEPVLLIHGFAASYQMNWELPGILDRLAKQYRVIALDNRGHGKSEKPHDVSEYGTKMVDDIVRLMDHLQLQQAHVVGYSMGGFITTRLLASHPDRIASAVIGGAGWSEHPEPRMKLLDEIGESLETGKGITPLLVSLTPKGKPAPSPQMLQASNQMILAMNDPKALAAAIRGMRSLKVERSLLENNQVPALAIVGAIDPLREGVDEMATVMNNLEVVFIEGADHMTAIRDPKLIEGILRHIGDHALSRVPVAVP